MEAVTKFHDERDIRSAGGAGVTRAALRQDDVCTRQSGMACGDVRDDEPDI